MATTNLTLDVSGAIVAGTPDTVPPTVTLSAAANGVQTVPVSRISIPLPGATNTVPFPAKFDGGLVVNISLNYNATVNTYMFNIPAPVSASPTKMRVGNISGFEVSYTAVPSSITVYLSGKGSLVDLSLCPAGDQSTPDNPIQYVILACIIIIVAVGISMIIYLSVKAAKKHKLTKLADK